MQSRVHSVLAALTLLVAAQAAPVAAQAAPTAAQETQDTSALPEALRSARANLSAAFAKLDGPAAAAVFGDSSSVNFQGQVITGKMGIAGWFQQVFSTLSGVIATGSSFTVADGEVRERAGYTATTPDGSQQGGSTETVWMKQADGTWKVSRFIVM